MQNEIIKAIQTIANSEKLKNQLEPNIMWHKTISYSETSRVLTAFLLFEAELKKRYKMINNVNPKNCSECQYGYFAVYSDDDGEWICEYPYAPCPYKIDKDKKHY